MSRKKSNSAVDIPSTPLMNEPPDSPFDEADEQTDNPPPTPGGLDNADNLDGRRRKKFACAGNIIVL